MKDIGADIKLTKDEAIKMLKETRAGLYSSMSKALRRRNFLTMRPSEQAMTQVRWQSQLVALDRAVEKFVNSPPFKDQDGD